MLNAVLLHVLGRNDLGCGKVNGLMMNCLITLLILLLWPITVHIPFPTTASEALSWPSSRSRRSLPSRACYPPGRCFRHQDGLRASKNRKNLIYFFRRLDNSQLLTFSVVFFVDMVCNQFMILRYLFHWWHRFSGIQHGQHVVLIRSKRNTIFRARIPRFPSPTPF